MEFRIPDVDHTRNYRDNLAAGCFAMAGTSLNDDKQATRQSYIVRLPCRDIVRIPASYPRFLWGIGDKLR